MKWVVYFLLKRPFGPRRATATLRGGLPDPPGGFVSLHAIEPTQSRSQYHEDGVGRLKFDFHTGFDLVPIGRPGMREVVHHARD